jgi:hypothetical protein
VPDVSPFLACSRLVPLSSGKRRHPGFTADLDDLLPVGQAHNFDIGFAVVPSELRARL